MASDSELDFPANGERDTRTSGQVDGVNSERKGALGRFTDRELAQLEQGLQTVCADLGLPACPKQFNELATKPRAVRRECTRQSPEAARLLREWGGIWKRVASFVPGRNWRQVYDTARRRYAANNYLGDWTEEQLELLERAVERYGPCWSKVAEEVGRFSASCRDKWRQSFENRSRLRGRWSSDERRRLLEAVKKFGGPRMAAATDTPAREHLPMNRQPGTRCSGSTEATSGVEAPHKRRHSTLDTHSEGFWTRVADYVGTRSEFQCRCEWQRHMDPRRISRRGSAHHTAVLNWQFLAVLEKYVTPDRHRQVPRDVSEIPWGQVHPELNAYRCYLWWRQLVQRFYPESPLLSSDAQVRRNASLLETIREVRVRLLQQHPELATQCDGRTNLVFQTEPASNGSSQDLVESS
ncbi:hypothetical protein CCYA_CCYA05G1650 [Cyanidiococcus yangmingshanensis]|nr:hypothetical protein CCYA_CCYA05G1650 [Cyanidiococcus yangmingshanensis]